MEEKIKVEGLFQLNRALRRVSDEAAKEIRLVGNAAADLLVAKTRPEIPAVTGRARASLKAQSTRTSARVAVGGRKAPWYPWLDFGGEGRIKGHPAHRDFRKSGRYLYPTLAREKTEIARILQNGLIAAARNAGLDVS